MKKGFKVFITKENDDREFSESFWFQTEKEALKQFEWAIRQSSHTQLIEPSVTWSTIEIWCLDYRKPCLPKDIDYWQTNLESEKD